MPILIKLQRHILSLIGYQLNEGVAISLGKSLSKMSSSEDPLFVKKHEVHEVYLENNNLKDSSLQMILKGLLGHKNLKKICYASNDLGVLSLDPFIQLVSRQRPK